PSPPTATLFPYTTLFRSVVTPAFVTSSGSMCTSRHITVESLRTVALPHPAVSVPANQAAANEARLESVLVLSTPFPAPSVSKGRSEEHTSELQSRFDLVC